MLGQLQTDQKLIANLVKSLKSTKKQKPPRVTTKAQAQCWDFHCVWKRTFQVVGSLAWAGALCPYHKDPKKRDLELKFQVHNRSHRSHIHHSHQSRVRPCPSHHSCCPSHHSRSPSHCPSHHSRPCPSHRSRLCPSSCHLVGRRFTGEELQLDKLQRIVYLTELSNILRRYIYIYTINLIANWIPCHHVYTYYIISHVCVLCIFLRPTIYSNTDLARYGGMFYHYPNLDSFHFVAWRWHRWWQRSARATLSYSPGWWWNHGRCGRCRWRCFAHDIGSRTSGPCRGPMDITGTEHLAQGHPLEQPKWLRGKKKESEYHIHTYTYMYIYIYIFH